MKRDNFTNNEIVDIVESFWASDESFGKGVSEKTKRDFIEFFNQAVDQIADRFSDFSRNPEKDHCALAWDTENKTTVHVGPLPPQ